MGKCYFKYLSQEFGSEVLYLVKQNGFYLYESMSGFEKFKEELPSKEKFYKLLMGKKFIDKEYEHVLKVWHTFEMKMLKDYLELYLKCDVLLLADVFEKIRNKSLKNYGLCLNHLSASWIQCIVKQKLSLNLSQM